MEHFACVLSLILFFALATSEVFSQTRPKNLEEQLKETTQKIDSDPTVQVYREIDEIEANLKKNAPREWTPSHDLWLGYLFPGQRQDLSFSFLAGRGYVVVAVCEKNCTRMASQMLEDGKVIEDGGGPPNRPAVSVGQTASDRTYTVRVTMKECAISPAKPCRIGLKAYLSTNKDEHETLAQRELKPPTEQEKREESVRRRLRIIQDLVSTNYAPHDDPHIGKINQGAYIDVPVELGGGLSYGFHATGDIYSNNVDLEVWREGKLVASDDSPGSEAMASVNSTPVRGRYVVRVKMMKCEKDPCSIGIQVFRLK